MDATGPWTPLPILLAGCHPHGPVDGALMDAAASRAGPFRDTFHFFKEFAVEAAQEQGVDEGAGQLPGLGRRLGALRGGEAADVGGNFRREQPAMLDAALVRLALDVQDEQSLSAVNILQRQSSTSANSFANASS